MTDVNQKDEPKSKESPTPEQLGIPKLMLAARWDPARGVIIGLVQRDDARDGDMVASVTYGNVSQLVTDLTAARTVADTAIAQIAASNGYGRGYQQAMADFAARLTENQKVDVVKIGSPPIDHEDDPSRED